MPSPPQPLSQTVPQVACAPRTSVTWPVRATSRIPCLPSSVSIASTLSPRPVTSSVIVRSVMSTTLARKTLAISMISIRVPGVALTLTRASSRSTVCIPSMAVARRTSTSLRSCLANCSVRSGGVSTTIVIRETSGSSVGPTERLWMFTPRRRISPATRTSTPGWFSTSTEIVAVCVSLIEDHLRHRLPRGDHRQAILLRIDVHVHDGGTVFRRQCRAERGLDLLGAVHADATCTERLGHLREVGVHQDGRGAAVAIEECLPLSDHPERPVFEDEDGQGQAVFDRRGQVLHRHLEAAVADHRHHLPVGTGELRAHRRREAEPHRAESAGRDERARPA